MNHPNDITYLNAETAQNLTTVSMQKTEITSGVSKSKVRGVFLGTYLIMFLGALMVYLMKDNFELFHQQISSTTFGSAFYTVIAALLVFKVLFSGFLLYNFLRYKPTASVADETLPVCTVIVPAYNEGRLVYDTLLSLAASNYPKEKLQLISIDDGSKDDTWYWMKAAKRELGDILSVYQQPHNMGKRHALYRGFHLAKGEVFVTVDSDSVVKEDTLRNLVSPIASDENCGAVAGNVKVLNTKNGIIPKMLNVSFAFSFEFVRSAQSNLGSVLCTPGALAAYRKVAVMNCLEDWINQTFLGNPSDIGEDRAMTNMILKQGFDVKFQRDAHVLTKIPENYNSLRKMFTRWERSNVRENIMMSKFAFRKFRQGSTFGPRLLLVNQWIGILAAYPLSIFMVFLIINHPLLFLSSTLLGVLIFNTIPAMFYAINHNVNRSFWAHTYGIFYSFSLFWITPYAIATAHRRGWLTRQLPENK